MSVDKHCDYNEKLNFCNTRRVSSFEDSSVVFRLLEVVSRQDLLIFDNKFSTLADLFLNCYNTQKRQPVIYFYILREQFQFIKIVRVPKVWGLTPIQKGFKLL